VVPLVPRVGVAGLQKERAIRQNDAETILVRGIPSGNDVLADLRHAAVRNRLLKETRELRRRDEPVRLGWSGEILRICNKNSIQRPIKRRDWIRIRIRLDENQSNWSQDWTKARGFSSRVAIRRRETPIETRSRYVKSLSFAEIIR